MIVSGRFAGFGHAKAHADWDSAGAFLLVRELFDYSSSWSLPKKAATSWRLASVGGSYFAR